MPKKKKSTQRQAVNVDNDVDERMVPAKHKGSGIYGEHIARYQAATGIVKGKIVLDIASGSGYGSHILAQSAKEVIGVDVSKDAIEYSKKYYASNNIRYLKGDGSVIPLEDNSVDVVTSFETIEHIKDYIFFMEEVKRVLKADGVFILSTPNELEFAEGNHFHLHEFEQEELSSLAKKYYANVEHYFQSTWKGNLIGRKKDMSTEWEKEINVNQLDPIEDERFLYFYFLCSDREIDEVIRPVFTISQHTSDRQVHEKELLTKNHIHNLEALIDAYKVENKNKELYIKELETRGIVYYVKKAVKNLSGRRPGSQ